MQNFPQRGVA